jgi:hypothetical protein
MIATFLDGSMRQASTPIIPAQVANAFRAQVLDSGLSAQQRPPFYGLSSIAGKLRRINSLDPGQPLRLYHKATGVLVKQTVSDAQGGFLFQYLDGSQDYYVVVIDSLELYDPAISPIVDLNA